VSERPSPALAALVEELAELIAGELASKLAPEGVADTLEERSPWLSVASAATYLDWPKQRLYKLSAAGAIPHYKHEGRLLFDRRELDEWLRAHAQGPARGRLDAGGETSYV
jgi:excisionase family DNA binding protein